MSELGLGVSTLGLMARDPSSQKKAVHLILYALDRGINFFDTADVDGAGNAEILLGRALAAERERVVIATKFGYVFDSRRNPAGGPEAGARDFSPKFTGAALEQSLKRLATDHIDIYQIHHPRMPDVERDDLYERLERFKRQGKILAWGAVLGPGREWVEEGRLLMNWRKPDLLAVPYNLFQQEPAGELMEEAEECGTSFLVREPLPSGMGLASPAVPKGPGDECFFMEDGPGSAGQDAGKIEALKFLAAGTGRSLAQSALKFAGAQDSVLSAIVDVWTEEQVNELSVVGEKPDLSSQELNRVRELYENRFDSGALKP